MFKFFCGIFYDSADASLVVSNTAQLLLNGVAFTETFLNITVGKEMLLYHPLSGQNLTTLQLPYVIPFSAPLQLRFGISGLPVCNIINNL